MKKFTVLLLILSIFCSLFAGCARRPAEPLTPGGTTEPLGTTAPPETTAPLSTTQPPETTVPPTTGAPEVNYPQEIIDMDKNYPIDEAYDYPVKPGSEEWKAFESRPEMVAACQVPEDLLPQMTTRALVETVLNYPFVKEISVHNLVRTGYKYAFSSSNAVKELEKRENAKYVINTFFADEFELQYIIWYGIDYTDDETHAYPIKPGTDEWNAMTEAEQIAACQIPEEKLAHMTTEALFVAVVNYPRITKLLEQGANGETLDALAEEFNGLKELLNRPNAIRAIRDGVSRTMESYAEGYKYDVLQFLNDKL